MRNIFYQIKHDSIVKTRAKQLEGQYREVLADLTGYNQPGLIDGYRPDILCRSSRTLLGGIQPAIFICEVETSDSYNTDHTYAQLKAFRAVRGAKLEFVVPRSVYDNAKSVMAVWDITIDSWLVFEG